jgi:tetrahydromethanopterin S-methyltransferase subunit G
VSAPVLAPPADPPQRPGRLTELNELARTTPGLLTLLTVVLVAVSVLVGVFSAISVQARVTALDDLTTRSGPLSVAAQEIYRSLSDADATATSAFLAGGEEPADQRARYQTDIAQAENALAIAVAAREPADVTAAGSPLATLSSQLSVYTGLVETARANNQQGLPVGAAYQREASNLMRTQLLPAAEELYRAETAQVAADQDAAGGFPFLEILLGVIALAALIMGQVFLRRSTNRVFNVGLVVATAAALVSLLWTIVATVGVMTNVGQSRDSGSVKVEQLAQARIATLTARSDETLTLVARGSGAKFEEDYVKVAERLGGKDGSGGLLGAASAAAIDEATRGHVDAAQQAWGQWADVHRQIRAADDGGTYTQAVQLAIGPQDNGATARFDQVDKELSQAIARTTQRFNDEVSQAGNAVTGTVIGIILLAVVMAAGAVAGIWQRLKEYR